MHDASALKVDTDCLNLVRKKKKRERKKERRKESSKGGRKRGRFE